MKNVIINADDFGARASVNKAIIELFNNGRLNSTTLMANMPGFDEAVELAHKHKITNKLGTHLVLTEGCPITSGIGSIPYFFHKEENCRELLVKKLFLLDKNQKKLIFKEYCAQIEKVRKNGIQISHLDTHQHMHDMWGIIQIIIELLKIYKIPHVRILNNLIITNYYKNTYRSFVNNYLKYKKINYTDYFGSQVDFLLSLEKYPNLIKNKTVEIMVHPDYNSEGKLIDLFLKAEHDFNFIK